MPPPCTDNWPAVKATAIARNSIKEAADLHGVPYSAARMRASREKWPVGCRPAKAVHDAEQFNRSQLAKVSPSSVTSVTATADALVTALADDEKQTRHDLSKAARKAARTLKGMPGLTIVSEAQNMKHVANTASMLHGWDKGQPVGVQINVLSAGGMMQ